MRVHLDTGKHAVWSKFGFNGDDGEPLHIVRRILQMPSFGLQGLHCHIGTFILDPDAIAIATRHLIALALEAEQLGAGPIRYLNLGGGFASRARLHYQYLPPEQATPPLRPLRGGDLRYYLQALAGRAVTAAALSGDGARAGG